MTRILFFIALAFVFWLGIRVLGGSRTRSAGDAARGAAARPAAVEAVSQCAWCGVHVPATSALTLPDGRLYCSDAHRDAARRVDAAERTPT